MLTLALVSCGGKSSSSRADSPIGGSGSVGSLRISQVVIPAPPPGADATSAFLVVENAGDTSVVIDGVSADGVRAVRIHETIGGQMQRLDQVAVPPGTRIRFAPGGIHLMMEGLAGVLSRGDTVALSLTLTTGETMTILAPVLRYGEAVRAVQ